MEGRIVLCQNGILNQNLNSQEMRKDRKGGGDNGRESFSKGFVCEFEVLVECQLQCFRH